MSEVLADIIAAIQRLFYNPMGRKALGAILRRVLGYGGTYLVARGVWTDEEAALYIAGAAGMVMDLSWSLLEKYRARKKLAAAQAMPAGATENQVEAVVKAGHAPPATLPKTTKPRAIRTPRKPREKHA